MIRRPIVLAVALGVAVIGCGGGGKGSPSASVTAPPTTAATTTTTLPVEEQVKAAYLRSWDVYADAVLRLDPSRLSEVLASPNLETVENEINKLRAKGRAVRVSVEHRINVRLIDSSTALVSDEIMNHSVEIDPASGAPTEADPNERLVDNYTLKMSEGTWKVAVDIRQG